MVKNINNYYSNFRLNPIVSSLMIFINDCFDQIKENKSIPFEYFFDFLRFLNPIAPHISEEILS